MNRLDTVALILDFKIFRRVYFRFVRHDPEDPGSIRAEKPFAYVIELFDVLDVMPNVQNVFSFCFAHLDPFGAYCISS